MSGVCSFSFGGAHVRPTQYFAANGNAASLSLANFLDVGTAIVLPVPMRIVAVSWQKLDENPGSFILMDATKNLLIDVSGANGATQIDSGEEFGWQIKLRALSSSDINVFRSCRITLYFQPLGNFEFIGLNAVPFGGKTSVSRFLLKFQGDIKTPVNNNDKDIGARFTVPSPMRLYRVGYERSSNIFLQVFKNGVPLDDRNRNESGTCTLSGASGVVDFNLAPDSPNRQLDAGDVIGLIATGSSSAACVITLYTTQGTRPHF